MQEELIRASQSGQPIRIHRTDGEVLVARVLGYDAEEIVCAVVTSSHPERYGVCDSTGFPIPCSSIERVRLLREPEHAG